MSVTDNSAIAGLLLVLQKIALERSVISSKTDIATFIAENRVEYYKQIKSDYKPKKAFDNSLFEKWVHNESRPRARSLNRGMVCYFFEMIHKNPACDLSAKEYLEKLLEEYSILGYDDILQSFMDQKALLDSQFEAGSLDPDSDEYFDLFEAVTQKVVDFAFDQFEGKKETVIPRGTTSPLNSSYQFANICPLTTVSGLRFVNRPLIQDDIKKMLFGNGRESRLLFVCGIGGSGKSELARQYAMSSFDEGQYTTVVPLQYKKDSSFEDVVKNCTDSIISGSIDRESSRAKILDILKQASENILIIVDDFDEYDNRFIHSLLTQTGKAKLLVTTRINKSLDLERGNIIYLDDEKYKEENQVAAIKILYAYAGKPNVSDFGDPEYQLIKTIVSQISYHPLCAALIGAQVNERCFPFDSPSLNEVLANLNCSLESALSKKKISFSKDDIYFESTPYNIVKTLFHDVLQYHFTERERQVLGALLTYGSCRTNRLCILVGDDVEGHFNEARQALEHLFHLGLIEITGNTLSEQFCSLHPLIKQLVTDSSVKDSWKPIAEIADGFIQHMEKNGFVNLNDTINLNPINYPEWESFIPTSPIKDISKYEDSFEQIFSEASKPSPLFFTHFFLLREAEYDSLVTQAFENHGGYYSKEEIKADLYFLTKSSFVDSLRSPNKHKHQYMFFIASGPMGKCAFLRNTLSGRDLCLLNCSMHLRRKNMYYSPYSVESDCCRYGPLTSASFVCSESTGAEDSNLTIDSINLYRLFHEDLFHEQIPITKIDPCALDSIPSISSIIISENVKEIGFASMLSADSITVPVGTRFNCTCGLTVLDNNFYAAFDSDEFCEELNHIKALNTYIADYRNLDYPNFSYVLGTDILIDDNGHLAFAENCHNYNYLLKAIEFRDCILKLRARISDSEWFDLVLRNPQLDYIHVFPVKRECIVTINNHHSRHLKN